jgi:hypothetical protein
MNKKDEPMEEDDDYGDEQSMIDDSSSENDVKDGTENDNAVQALIS